MVAVTAACYSGVTASAGWSSSVARWAHNPEVAGSNPAPATTELERPLSAMSARAFRRHHTGICSRGLVSGLTEKVRWPGSAEYPSAHPVPQELAVGVAIYSSPRLLRIRLPGELAMTTVLRTAKEIPRRAFDAFRFADPWSSILGEQAHGAVRIVWWTSVRSMIMTAGIVALLSFTSFLRDSLWAGILQVMVCLAIAAGLPRLGMAPTVVRAFYGGRSGHLRRRVALP